MTELAGRRVVVIGGARSGVATAAFLVRQGARATVSDSRPMGELAFARELAALADAGVTLDLGGHDFTLTPAPDLIVVSPGVPSDLAALERARAAGVQVVGDVEFASWFLQGPIVAITGTKGKSTTSTLVERMLERSGLPAMVGGNIGTPLAAQIADSTAETRHVVEVSSFQLEMTRTFHPWIAVLLNLSADHLDRHGTLAAYARAKARIFANQGPGDWAVVNVDDPPSLALSAGIRARIARFALSPEAGARFTVSEGIVVDRSPEGTRALVPVAALRVPGRHTLADMVAAAAAATLAGATPAGISAAVAAFTGLEHAMEVVATIAGVGFVNDSKATNIAAARRSIESVERDLVVILGGRWKGGDFRDLREALGGRARAVVAIGEATPLVVSAIGDLVPVTEARSMSEAVRQAFEAARPAGTVVLAPACASFDMFADYAERGRRFKEEVARLAAERAPREQ